MQNFGVTNKEHYGMLWYFLEWSIATLEIGPWLWRPAVLVKTIGLGGVLSLRGLIKPALGHLFILRNGSFTLISSKDNNKFIK